MNDPHIDDDQKLVAFLKAYRPIPPPVSQAQEEKLMASLLSPTSPKYTSYPWRLLIPSAIAGLLLLLWGGYRLQNNSLQMATDTSELETFVFNSWSSALGYSEESFADNTPEDQWLLLTDTQPTTNFSTSNP